MVSLGVCLPRLPFAQCAPLALQGSPQWRSVKRRENRYPQIYRLGAAVTKDYGRYNRSNGYSWSSGLSSSGDFEYLAPLRMLSCHVLIRGGCRIGGVNFSVNSRLLFRKPAILHGVAPASVPPDPDAPLATRHPPLLFHKPLSLYRLQSSIPSPIEDVSTDRVLALPWV